jgi:hypothetical protein
MIEETVAQLTGEIRFDIDMHPLAILERKMKQIGRDADRLSAKLKRAMTMNTAANKQVSANQKAAQQAQMQTSKFTLATAQQQSKLDVERTKQAMAQLKLRNAEHAAASKAAQAKQKEQLATFKAQGQELANKLKMTRLSDLEGRIAARNARAQARAAQANPVQGKRGIFSGFRRGGDSGLAGATGRMAASRGGYGSSHMSASRASGGSNFSFGAAASFGGLAMAATAATAAITLMAAAASKFVAEAERSANAQQQRLAQFKVASGSEAGAAGMEARYQKLADFLGVDSREGGRDYGKLTGALAKRMGVDQSEQTAAGIMSYGKAQGMSGEEMKNMNRGLLQALGKNQLYAEEWTGQIAEHLGANANQFGAEAYQRAIGGKLTGQNAADQFMKDRKDGKIKGDVLINFMKQLGQVLAQHANDGGALDIARQSQESRRARFSNQMNENLTHAYNNSGLKESTGPMYEAAGGLLKALGPQFDQFATLSTTFVKAFTSATGAVTDFVNAMNSNNQKAKDAYVSEEARKRYEESSAQFNSDFGKLADTIGKVWADISKTKQGAGVFDELVNLWSTTLQELAAISRGLNQIVDALLYVAAKFGYTPTEPKKPLTPAAGTGMLAMNPDGSSPQLSVPRVSLPSGNQSTVEAPAPSPLLPVPKAPISAVQMSPATTAAINTMSVLPSTNANPPALQSPATTNNIKNDFKIELSVQVDAKEANAADVGRILEGKAEEIAHKAVQRAIDLTAGQQVKRY